MQDAKKGNEAVENRVATARGKEESNVDRMKEIASIE